MSADGDATFRLVLAERSAYRLTVADIGALYDKAMDYTAKGCSDDLEDFLGSIGLALEKGDKRLAVASRTASDCTKAKP